MNNTKPWWQSKTILVNALILLIAMADAARALPLPPEWTPYLVAIIPVLNVALRLTTSSGIAGFAPGEDPVYRAAHDASGDPAPQTERLAPLQWFPTSPEQQAEFDKWRASLPTPEQTMRSQSTPAPDHAPDPPAPGLGEPSLRDKLERDLGLPPEPGSEEPV